MLLRRCRWCGRGFKLYSESIQIVQHPVMFVYIKRTLMLFSFLLTVPFLKTLLESWRKACSAASLTSQLMNQQTMIFPYSVPFRNFTLMFTLVEQQAGQLSYKKHRTIIITTSSILMNWSNQTCRIQYRTQGISSMLCNRLHIHFSTYYWLRTYMQGLGLRWSLVSLTVWIIN